MRTRNKNAHDKYGKLYGKVAQVTDMSRMQEITAEILEIGLFRGLSFFLTFSVMVSISV
jgi:hypothetical protein